MVGLKSLVDDENQNGEDVVDVLQLVFNRFDQLADLFKVQKVRKTVNEYYMVAAGLPDPTLLEEAGARACACAALAHSMVQMMDIINSDPVARDLAERRDPAEIRDPTEMRDGGAGTGTHRCGPIRRLMLSR